MQNAKKKKRMTNTALHKTTYSDSDDTAQPFQMAETQRWALSATWVAPQSRDRSVQIVSPKPPPPAQAVLLRWVGLARLGKCFLPPSASSTFMGRPPSPPSLFCILLKPNHVDV